MATDERPSLGDPLMQTERGREEALRQSAEGHAFQLQLGDALRDLTDPAQVQAVALRLLGEHLGASRVAWGMIEEDQGVVLRIEQDYHSADTPSVVGVHPSHPGSINSEGLLAGATVVVEDVNSDPRLTDEERARFRALRMMAWIAAPLVAEGRPVAVLTAQQNAPRAWTPHEVSLVRSAADRVWATMRRASAEKALAETERRYQELVQFAPSGIYEVDFRTQRFTSVNDAIVRISGYSREELLEMNPFDILEDESRARFRVRIAQWLSGEKPEPNVEYRIKTKDGRAIDTVLAVTFKRDSEGRPLGASVVAHDITERKRAQEALRESEARRHIAEATMAERQRLFDVLETLPVMVCLLAPDCRVLFANRSFRERFGEAQGRACYEYCFGQNAPCAFCESYRVLETGRPHHWEVTLPDGAIIEAHDFPFTDLDGTPLILEMDLDVTAQRRAEAELAEHHEQLEQLVSERTARLQAANAMLSESRERYRMLFDSIDEGFSMVEVLFDGHGRPVDYRFLETNPAFEVQTGLRDAIGKRMRELEPRHEQHWFDIYGRIALTGVAERFENRAQYLSGQWYDVYAFRVGRPEEHKVAVLFRDISSRKRAEEALRQVNETLEQRVAERTQQLRALAARLVQAEEQERHRMAQTLHDGLQQSLVAAALQLNVAMRYAEKESHSWIHEALHLLDEALATSRSLTAELSPAILHDDGLAPALSWLARRMNERYGLEVALEVSESAASRRIPEEAAILLFQSASELLFNVHKHAGVTEVELALLCDEQGTLELRVADRGRGFEALPSAEMESGGFGLFSVQERMVYAGGLCIIESAPGRGTKVTLTLPLGPRAAVAQPPQTETMPLAEPAPASARPPLRLLLVDDHAIVRRGMAQLLGIEPDLSVVGEAGDGAEGVALTRRLRPDVVLMDINMPQMDGIEATRRIVAECPGTIVIGLSMYEDKEKEKLMRQAGVADYIAKGGPPESLVAAIRACRGD